MWELLFSVPRCHKWFRDEFGRTSPADNSGKTPDETDDGVLILIEDQSVSISDDGYPIVWLRDEKTGHRVQLGGTSWEEVGILRDRGLVSFA